LTTRLEELTPALVQAAALIQEKCITADQYLKLLGESGQKFIDLLSEEFETYMNWQDELAGQLLSVIFSKTILCSRIVEHLAATYVKFVAYFFLSSDHESRNDPYAVVRSWLSQLAAQPDVYDLIRPKWETTQDQVAPRATVVQLLRDVLQARPGCIPGVDDLDECTAPADSSSSITRFLEDVKNAITPATRVLVNCRDEPEIRQTLRANDSYSLAEYQISPRDVMTTPPRSREYEGIPTDELPDVIIDDYISSEIVELCGPLVEVRGPRPAAEARIVH
ncbi:putative helicase C6F12.16c, partial [Verticillium dahliae VDG2]